MALTKEQIEQYSQRIERLVDTKKIDELMNDNSKIPVESIITIKVLNFLDKDSLNLKYVSCDEDKRANNEIACSQISTFEAEITELIEKIASSEKALVGDVEYKSGIFEKKSTSSILNALKKAIVAKLENGEVEICK